MDNNFTPKLIAAVKKHPVIYTRGSMSGYNYQNFYQAWKEIQKELDVDLTIIKDKWKNLKDTYIRMRKRNGSNMTWRWANHMSFMEGTEKQTDNEVQNITGGNTEYNLNEAINVENDFKEEPILSDSEASKNYEFIFENTEEELQEPNQQKSKKRKLPEEPTIDPLILDNNLTNVQCDRVDLLFLGYANSLKRLSHIKQVIVKYKISKIIMEAELSEIKQ